MWTYKYQTPLIGVGTRKWGNGKKAQSLHSTQQTAEMLLLQSSMIKSMSIQYLYWEEYLSILYGLHQRGMQRHCIMVGKLVLHFWQFVKFMHYSYPVPTFYEESFWAVFGFLLHSGATCIHICFTYMQHYYLQKHVLWDNSTRMISTSNSMDQVAEVCAILCQYMAAFLTREG